MPQTGASFFTTALEQYGVRYLFGNPGTTELPIMDAISQSDLEYVLALHEDVAVGMAAGYAKTRSWHRHGSPEINPIGVVNLHVTPGLAHGIGNLFDSGQTGSGAPILLTAGAHALGHQHREPNLHGELVELTEQFTKWSAEVKEIDSFPGILRRAVRVALTPPTGPVFLALPFDVMTAQIDAEPERLGAIPHAGAGDERDLESAADAIVSASEPVMIVGDRLARGGPDAVAAAVEFAETSGARVHGEFRLSEIAFPTTHDQYAGGLPDDREVATELMDTDLVVFAGTISNVPTNPPDVPSGALPGTTSIHISDSAWELGKNYVADIGIIGEPGRVLGALTNRVRDQIPDTDRDQRLQRIQTHTDDWTIERDSDTGPDGVASKEEFAAGIQNAAPDALVIAESSTSTSALVDAYDFEPGQFVSQRGGGLGYGLPAAIGTAIAEGETDMPRDVIGFIGDGAYLFYPNAMYSAARYNVDLTVIVADNRNYRILKNNMLNLFGGNEDDYDFIGMDFDPPVDIPKNAESHGATGRFIDDPTLIEPAVAQAVNESGPTVLDILIHD